MSGDGIIQIHGRDYVTVARRIVDFREAHPEWSIETEVLTVGDLVKVRAVIADASGRTLATGHAEEDRTLGNINKTSAVENCETSAVGRALAFLGFGGTEIRSADEMATADYQQQVINQIEYMAMVRDEWDTINAVKAFLIEENVDAAREAFKELAPEKQMALWRAPTKGGVFTTQERKLLKEGV